MNAQGSDRLHLMSGNGYGNAYQNELWMFDCTLNQWMFLSSGTDSGTYTSVNPYPGARIDHQLRAIPKTSLLVLVHLYKCYLS